MGQISMISDEYAAGFFDGEGSVYLNLRHRAGAPDAKRETPMLKICISNTYLPVLEQFKGRWGGSISKRKRPSERRRDQWQWTLSTRQCRPLLEAMAPHLLEKQELARLALAYLDLMEMPGQERRDYTKTITIRSKRTGRLRKTVVPTNRPEWTARRDAIAKEIRARNARGLNARRAA